MESGLSPRQIDELQRSIVYLKMNELRHLSQALGLSLQGQKRDLIARIMARVGRTDLLANAPRKRLRRAKQDYELDAPLRPESYTNGSASRQFLTKQIGDHFRFTTFGMDWIKEQWQKGLVPTFREFILFWEQEYKERKAGKSFISKPELTRVNFYRRTSEQGNSRGKNSLNELWKDERAKHVSVVRSILAEWKQHVSSASESQSQLMIIIITRTPSLI